MGLVIPVDKLEYQEVPDSYFDVTGVVIIPDNQNQYIKFVEFMSGEYQILMSGKYENLNQSYKKISTTGDYGYQMNIFLSSESWQIQELVNYYNTKVIWILSKVLLTGNWWVFSNQLDYLLMLPSWTQKLVRDLNIISSWYCVRWDIKMCKIYQKFAIIIWTKQLETHNSVIGFLGLLNSKSSFKNIIYNKDKWLGNLFVNDWKEVLKNIDTQYFYKSLNKTARKTVFESNWNLCAYEKNYLEWFSSGNIALYKCLWDNIDMEEFTGYLNDTTRQYMQCWEDLNCTSKINTKVQTDLHLSLLGRLLAWFLWSKHREVYMSKILLKLLIPSSGETVIKPIIEVKDLINLYINH